MRDRMLEPSEGNEKAEERVTLKKEIGLMSACAIIIGECTESKSIGSFGNFGPS